MALTKHAREHIDFAKWIIKSFLKVASFSLLGFNGISLGMYGLKCYSQAFIFLKLKSTHEKVRDCMISIKLICKEP